MARHVWTVLCRSSAVDKETNLISLLEAVENLATSEEAADDPEQSQFVIPMAQLVTLWMRTDVEKPETARSRAYVVGPSGKKSDPITVDIDLSGKFIRYRQRLMIPGWPAMGPGIYEWCVELRQGKKWKKVATVPVTVSLLIDQVGNES